MPEDTEWEDILVAHGILPPKSSYQSSRPLYSISPPKPSAFRKGKEESSDDSDFGLEEDPVERAIFDKYKAQRTLSALKQTHFNEVVEISQPEFVKEVTLASKQLPVILHLYQDGNADCVKLNEELINLSRDYPTAKFLKIVATRCIPNYPDKNVPTLLIYSQGDLLRQLVGIAQIGPLRDLRALLQKLKVLPTEESDEDF